MQAKLKKLTGKELRRQTLDRPLVIKTITINRRVVAGDHGGIAYVDFTLPWVSMHAAAREADRQGGARGF
ncbi:hypothetical protein SAMN05216228_100243 [Rhizobium tibeticum]|uniref:Uncharacterized protein n=1 Tax=Rhizobium tibeticum TaxID=501024 RepID=A0A1H8DFU5_9HYPH|nr:hypothetical protein [Rhizobium tibeticum]SEH51671.1 hypothetical protein RTCCBAU85039_0864 [Rhizobium tibeticum]SEN06173.1 hypothetical protein SAMN05216228_100243 [Rhizobium tibeticum]